MDLALFNFVMKIDCYQPLIEKFENFHEQLTSSHAATSLSFNSLNFASS